MDLSDKLKYLHEYIEGNSSEEDDILSELRRYTYLKVIHSRMISGPVQGGFLEMISKILQPLHILEVGTYTGYSAICLARGLKEGGKLITLEVNDEHIDIAKHFIQKAGLSDKIECIHANALEYIPSLDKEFDLIFIDGNKEEYANYYKLCIPKLKAGGLMLVDNVLWEGKVLEEGKNMDKTTQSIIQFNKIVKADKNVQNVILPLRDGLTLIRKISLPGEVS